jgi:hypothetical protein
MELSIKNGLEMKAKHILYSLLLILPMLFGCQEDDINEIFVSGTWNVGNFYNGGDWNKYDNDGGRAKYTKAEDIRALNALTITFQEDGTLQGRLANNATLTGRWQANGDKRTISITNLKTSNSVTGKSKELVEALENAAYYKGDKNYLKLAPATKNSYVQLGHYPQ